MSPSVRWRRLLTIGLVAAAFGFVLWRIATDAAQLREFDWEFRPGILLLSLGLQIGVLVSGVWVWRLVLSRFGAEVLFRPLARAWFLSNLSRYVPGVVWQFITLAQLGGAAGLTGAAAVTSVLVHMGFLLLAAGAVGIHLLPPSFAGEFAAWLPPLRWASPTALLLVHPAVVGAATRVAARMTRGAVEPWRGTWVDGLAILLVSGLAWVVSGVAFFTFVSAFVPLSLADAPALIACNALGFFFGYLVVIAPGGAGIKEGVLTLLLTALVPGSVAASLAILSRLWTIAAEIVPALFLARRGRSTLGPAQTPPVTGA